MTDLTATKANGKPTLKQYLTAGYPVLWCETHEEDRAIQNYKAELTADFAHSYNIYVWDIMNGLIDYANGGKTKKMDDPLAPLKELPNLPQSTVLFLKDFHKFIGSVDIMRYLKNLLPTLKATDRHVIMVGPVCNVPIELEKDITIMSFGLPTIDELLSMAERIRDDNNLDCEIVPATIERAKGLTANETENALALSVVTRAGQFNQEVIENEKLQIVRKSGRMEIWESTPESELGGLGTLKSYINNRKIGFTDSSLPTPRGILLTGLPGGGKSLSAKVIASVLAVPLIRLDLSSLKGSLVGQSTKNLRECIAVIEAIGLCVIWYDEFEKFVSGAQSSARSDGGTTNEMVATLLTWMAESHGRYHVATCNDVGALLETSQGALMRRFDDTFFVDVPSDNEKIEILEIMNRRYGTDIPVSLIGKMKNWTGAEIEKCVIASCYDGLDQAVSQIRPIATQNKEIIDKVRLWADYNAIKANTVEDRKAGKQAKVRKLQIND